MNRKTFVAVIAALSMPFASFAAGTPHPVATSKAAPAATVKPGVKSAPAKIVKTAPAKAAPAKAQPRKKAKGAKRPAPKPTMSRAAMAK